MTPATDLTEPMPPPDISGEWKAWAKLALDRLPVPYWVFMVGAGVLVFVEQMIEQTWRDPTFALLSPELFLRRLAFALLTMYMLMMMRVLKQRGLYWLDELRPSVNVADGEYDQHVERILKSSARRELGLLAVALVTVVLVFFVFHTRLPINPQRALGPVYVPPDAFAVLIFTAAYTVFGWAGLNLLFASLQAGVGLGRLAQQPLAVNVFDVTNVLPFGNIVVINSLSVAGIVIVLLTVLGAPEFVVDYAVIFVAAAISVLALVLPMRGVRAQMSHAKRIALVHINREFAEHQHALLSQRNHTDESLRGIQSSCDSLSAMRKSVLAQPGWPFRGGAGVVRGLLISFLPVIYFVINELLRTFVLSALNTARP